MKLLHTSEFRTTSDSNAKVDTVERYTFPDGQPYREIAVKVDADMTPAEARRLIVDLQHAIALAEEQPAGPDLIAAKDAEIADLNEAYAEKRAELIKERERMDAVVQALVSGGADLVGNVTGEEIRELAGNLVATLIDERRSAPAVSEDQPKPREWHKGDAEPPADVTVLEDEDGDQLTRTGNGGWLWTRISGRDHTVPPKWTGVLWGDLDWDGYTRLSEVLADSEQVRHG